MSARAVIDSLEFVRSGTELKGVVQVAQLERLADSLHDRSGNLEFKLRGQTDGQHRPRLLVEVAGTLNLRCQRCLGRLPHRIEVHTYLLLLAEPASGEEVDIEDLDAVAASPELDVWSLVEDEVVLVQPIAPMHADGECQVALETDKDRAASPFAVLAGLKQKQVN